MYGKKNWYLFCAEKSNIEAYKGKFMSLCSSVLEQFMLCCFFYAFLLLIIENKKIPKFFYVLDYFHDAIRTISFGIGFMRRSASSHFQISRNVQVLQQCSSLESWIF
jgi:hypothetical protein